MYKVKKILKNLNKGEIKMEKFKGIAEPNYTQVPNIYIDDLMSELTGSELKVLMYITRRTFGFGKKSDNISLNQIANGITKKDGTILDKGTGLSIRQVIYAINILDDKGIIKKVKRASKEKGLEATNYSLKFKKDLFEPLCKNFSSPNAESSVVQKKVIQHKEIQQQENEKNVVADSKNGKELIDKLIELKVKKEVAESIVKEQDHKKIEKYMAYVKQKVSQGSDIKSIPGYLIDAIKNSYKLPENFKTESDISSLREKQANRCYSNDYEGLGDCLVEGTIRLKPCCDYCKKVKGDDK